MAQVKLLVEPSGQGVVSYKAFGLDAAGITMMQSLFGDVCRAMQTEVIAVLPNAEKGEVTAVVPVAEVQSFFNKVRNGANRYAIQLALQNRKQYGVHSANSVPAQPVVANPAELVQQANPLVRLKDEAGANNLDITITATQGNGDWRLRVDFADRFVSQNTNELIAIQGAFLNYAQEHRGERIQVPGDKPSNLELSFPNQKACSAACEKFAEIIDDRNKSFNMGTKFIVNTPWNNLNQYILRADGSQHHNLIGGSNSIGR